MSAQRLQRIMEVRKKRTLDIASELQISTGPIQKYLDEDPSLSRGYRRMIDHYVVEQEQVLANSQKVAE